MKAVDIALKDLLRSLRSMSAVIFMFGVPLVVTGMMALLLGNVAKGGEYSIPPVKVVIANLDEGGPNLRLRGKNVPGDIQADTLGELVVKVLQSSELARLIEARTVADAAAARALVDAQQAGVAIVIPPDFSRQFTDLNAQAQLEFYQDPTLTIGPGIVRAVLNQFMDGMAGINITADIAIEESQDVNPALAGEVIQRYLQDFFAQDEDLTASMLETQPPFRSAGEDNPLLKIIAPIMGGMMIFYAFYTATFVAEGILREDEEHTLPRLFTTPTPPSLILSGKFLSVFLTVGVQMATLLAAAHLIFGIDWGQPSTLALLVPGVVCAASSTGIFIVSFVKSTKQGAIVFGGVLTVSGMLGMIRVFAPGTERVEALGNSVALLVPQGWATKGLMIALHGDPPAAMLVTALGLLVWSAVFLTVGVRRFRRRYA